MHKVTPFLWFNDNGEEAMDFYVSIFPNSRVLERTPGERAVRYPQVE
jgi:predicted 3-demethylubiquinone-9 3-methyltransferase (glyoxalase superfamily)